MIEIKAPETSLICGFQKSLFLGGGISNCPNWQNTMVSLLEDTDLTLLNPRRDHFDVGDSSLAVTQIKWEFSHLNRAKSIMFWFPCETLCPITLYELGYWCGAGNKKIFVGCHPDYARKLDVEVQTSLVRLETKIVFSLEDLAQQIKDYWK